MQRTLLFGGGLTAQPQPATQPELELWGATGSRSATATKLAPRLALPVLPRSRLARRDGTGGVVAALVVLLLLLAAAPSAIPLVRALKAAPASDGELPTQPAPAVMVGHGHAVHVTLSDGPSFANRNDTAPVAHRVYRQSPDGSVVQKAGGSCANDVYGTSCADAAVPAGTWRYVVRPVLLEAVGEPSPPSSAITVAASEGAGAAL